MVQVLADEGVDTVFGYSGGAILPIYDAVFRYNDKHPVADGEAAIQLVVPANEQGAGFMAAGYCTSQRQSRCRHGDVRSRRYQYGDTRA